MERRIFTKQVVLHIIVLAFILILNSCGDDWEGPPQTYDPFSNGVWISIDEYDIETTTNKNYTSLIGDVSAKRSYSAEQCPVGPDADMLVSWENVSSGATGYGYVGWRIAYSYYSASCMHMWVADVPLVLGENRITVIAIQGEQSNSDSITITRLLGPPTGVSATPGYGQVTIIWNPDPEIAVYKLHWTTRDANSLSVLPYSTIPNIAESSYVHTGLLHNVEYIYFVTAITGSVESAASRKVSVMTF